MSPDGTIAARHVWKRFHADRKRPVLRDEIEHLRTRRREGTSTRWRWALRDVDLEIAAGQAVGLFGTNGSGKSTLLKILTRVMYPYAGSVEVQGRVGALIEVKAGIHPELTGRENIYLYGSLLGLSRADVRQRFDAIVEFSELADAVDRAVKFYSSGMSMRLGFAVAAFLEPDILLVDEVLAVGDASFQQKCLNRMRDVIESGTTLVFVSHDLPTIEAICSRGVWLHNGVVRASGPVREALASYRAEIEHEAEIEFSAGTDRVGILAARVAGPARSLEPIRFDLRLAASPPVEGVLCLGVSEGPSAPTFVLRNPVRIDQDGTAVACTLPSLPLPRGRFCLWASVLDHQEHALMEWQPAAWFEVQGPDLPAGPPGVMRLGPTYVDARWEVEPAAGTEPGWGGEAPDAVSGLLPPSPRP